MSRVAITLCVVVLASAVNAFDLDLHKEYKKWFDTRTKDGLDKINNKVSLYAGEGKKIIEKMNESAMEYISKIKDEISARADKAEKNIEREYGKYHGFQGCDDPFDKIRKLKKSAFENVDECTHNNVQNAWYYVYSITDTWNYLNRNELITKADDCITNQTNVINHETYAATINCIALVNANVLVESSKAERNINDTGKKFKYWATNFEMWKRVCGISNLVFKRMLKATLKEAITCGQMSVNSRLDETSTFPSTLELAKFQ